MLHSSLSFVSPATQQPTNLAPTAARLLRNPAPSRPCPRQQLLPKAGCHASPALGSSVLVPTTPILPHSLPSHDVPAGRMPATRHTPSSASSPLNTFTVAAAPDFRTFCCGGCWAGARCAIQPPPSCIGAAPAECAPPAPPTYLFPVFTAAPVPCSLLRMCILRALPPHVQLPVMPPLHSRRPPFCGPAHIAFAQSFSTDKQYV